MATKTTEPYVAPPDPPFQDLARDAYLAWKADAPDLLAFDTETEGLDFHDPPFCVTVAWPGSEPHYLELGDEKRETAIKHMLERTPRIVGHNIKFDLQKLILVGLMDRGDLTPERIHDTQALAHLDDEHRPKALKSLAVELLGVDDTIEVEIKSGKNAGQTKRVPRDKHELDAVRRKLKLKRDDGFHVLPRAVLYPYALKDAEFTRDLFDVVHEAVLGHEDLRGLYRQEMELTLVFLDMESAGLGVDEEYVRRMVGEYIERVIGRESEIAAILGRPVLSAVLPESPRGKDDPVPFNPASNPQIAEVFTSAGYPRDNYAVGVLSNIDHPLAPALLALRSDLKMLNTYFRALQKGTRDGVFHPSFRQHGTVTGRTSSGAAQAD